MSNDSYLDPLNDEVRDGPISLHEIVIPEDTPLPSVKPAILAGGIAASVAAIYFVVSMGNGMAFGPWQGAYLDPSFPYRTPLISLWLGRAMAAIPLGDAAWRLSFVSALFGAAACGMLAIIAARSLRERSGTGAAVIAGVASGLLFALTPTWSATIISNAPAVTTVLLALSGLACLQHAIETHAPRWLLPTGTAIGLATVNDPSFAIVLIIALLAALGTLGERVPVGRVFAMLFAGFALTASIPFARAMFDGEGTDGFLHHAIATAYPTIGDGLPRLGFGLELRPQFSWMVLAATILGLTALFLRGMRGAATMWALLFLAMGPFWPALTNQRSSEYVLRETGAAESIACAAVCICALWGAAWLARAITRGNQGRLAAAVAAVTAAGMLGFQVAELPARDSALAATIADRMLADCGRDALLVTGDARTTALLRTAQISRGVRTDVGIVAVHALEQGETRSALSKLHGDSLSVARDFPPDNAWTRWPVERPNEFGTLNATMMSGGLRESDFRDLMLWEFMRDNFADRKIHFAGVTSAWLTARGRQVGMLLQFPRDDVATSDALDLAKAQQPPASVEPELAKTMVSILLPLAEASRRQNDIANAKQLTELARAFGANDAGVWLSSARAAARGGERETAVNFAADYLRLATSEQEMEKFLELIEEDLERNALAVEFSNAAIEPSPDTPTKQRRQQLAQMLWGLDEVTVLAAGYNVALQIGPRDFDLILERAAALAQLGELEASRALLGEAVKRDFDAVWSRMQWDGRFYLLEVKRPEFSPKPAP